MYVWPSPCFFLSLLETAFSVYSSLWFVQERLLLVPEVQGRSKTVTKQVHKLLLLPQFLLHTEHATGNYRAAAECPRSGHLVAVGRPTAIAAGHCRAARSRCCGVTCHFCRRATCCFCCRATCFCCCLPTCLQIVTSLAVYGMLLQDFRQHRFGLFSV